jgi:predicted amidohydrolase
MQKNESNTAFTNSFGFGQLAIGDFNSEKLNSPTETSEPWNVETPEPQSIKTTYLWYSCGLILKQKYFLKNIINKSLVVSTLLLCSFVPFKAKSTLAQQQITSNPNSLKMKIRITIAQIFCLDGDRAGNLVRIENALKEAKKQQADIVVFPESCIYGWINPVAHQKAATIPGRDSDILCDFAKKYQLFICIGLDERDESRLFDSAILIDDKGQIILKHRKINVLPDLMTPSYAVGEGVQAVETKFGKIGVMICADSFQEDLLASMNALKPDLVLIPYGWAAPETEWPQHGLKLTQVVKNVALKLTCPVVGTDLVGQVSSGPWTGQIYGGQSLACDQNGHVIATGKDRERDILTIEIERF